MNLSQKIDITASITASTMTRLTKCESESECRGYVVTLPMIAPEQLNPKGNNYDARLARYPSPKVISQAHRL